MLLLQVYSSSNGVALLLIFQLVIRFIGAIVCYNKSKELQREPTGWVVFGFFIPIIAMIWIYCLKPKGFGNTTSGGIVSSNTISSSSSGYKDDYDGGHNNAGTTVESSKTIGQLNKEYKNGDFNK